MVFIWHIMKIKDSEAMRNNMQFNPSFLEKKLSQFKFLPLEFSGVVLSAESVCVAGC